MTKVGHGQHQGHISDTNPQPSVTLPQQLPTEVPDKITLADGREVNVVAFQENTDVMAFTRTQLQRMTPDQYAANKDKIQQAQELNLIIDDTVTPEQRERQNAALRASSDAMLKAIALRDARAATNTTLKAWQDAQAALDVAKRTGDQYEIQAAEQRLADTNTTFAKANSDLKALEAPAE